MTDENPIQRVGEGQAGPSAAERLAREILAPMIEDAEDVRMPLGVAKRMSVPAVTAIIATALRASEASVEIGTRQNRALAEEVESLRDEVEALAGTIRRITEASGAARAEATEAVEALEWTVKFERFEAARAFLAAIRAPRPPAHECDAACEAAGDPHPSSPPPPICPESEEDLDRTEGGAPPPPSEEPRRMRYCRNGTRGCEVVGRHAECIYISMAVPSPEPTREEPR